MRQRLFSIWTWFAVLVIVLVWFPWMVLLYAVTVPFDPGRYTIGRWFRRAAVLASTLNPLWSFRTSGTRIRDPRRPYVVVSNHESMADIFLISHLPWEMKWLAKAELFRIPLLGWMMRMGGDIPVRRSDRTSRGQAVEQCRDRLRKKVSVMIFPEGTRSRSGDLLPFADGAFRLAIEFGVPVLPMAVVGTRTALAKGSMLFGRARAEVRVLDPIPTDGMTLNDVAALRERVRDRIRATREEMQRELAPPAPAAGRRLSAASPEKTPAPEPEHGSEPAA